MPNPRMKQRRVVHKSTAGILKPIPEAVDLVGNPPLRLTTKTVALLHQRVGANPGNPTQPNSSAPIRGVNILFNELQQQPGQDRLHQFVRSLEALILPDVGNTKHQFAHRCQTFARGCADTRATLLESLDIPPPLPVSSFRSWKVLRTRKTQSDSRAAGSRRRSIEINRN